MLLAIDARYCEAAAAIRDAEKWLDEHWQIDRNPKAHHHHYCYLYALERIGSLAGRELIGSHPWYREGADYLLAEQERKSGKWVDTSSCTPTDILGTCFAILFLKRATRTRIFALEAARTLTFFSSRMPETEPRFASPGEVWFMRRWCYRNSAPTTDRWLAQRVNAVTARIQDPAEAREARHFFARFQRP